MNMYADPDARYATTVMRKPDDVRYILYDFGYSLMCDEDADISSVSDTRYLNFMHAPSPEGAYNPFKADVSMMAGLLFGYVAVRLRYLLFNWPSYEHHSARHGGNPRDGALLLSYDGVGRKQTADRLRGRG